MNEELLVVGTSAPKFSLPDQTGKIHQLADYRGQSVLLYFYPKDDTPGCTTEACTIRDAFKQFQSIGIVVLGVSGDSVDRHKKFATKYKLPFPILSDPEKAVIKAYGAWGKKKFLGREYDGIKRISYLIDPKGKIANVFERVKPADHAAEVLKLASS